MPGKRPAQLDGTDTIPVFGWDGRAQVGQGPGVTKLESVEGVEEMNGLVVPVDAG